MYWVIGAVYGSTNISWAIGAVYGSTNMYWAIGAVYGDWLVVCCYNQLLILFAGKLEWAG